MYSSRTFPDQHPGPIDLNPFFRVSRARGRCCPSSASTDSYPPHPLLSRPGVSQSANPRQPRPHVEVIPHHRQERHDEPAAEHLVAVREVAVLLTVQDASQQVDVAEHGLVALLLVSEDVQHHALVCVPVEGGEGTEEQRIDWGLGYLVCRHAGHDGQDGKERGGHGRHRPDRQRHRDLVLPEMGKENRQQHERSPDEETGFLIRHHAAAHMILPRGPPQMDCRPCLGVFVLCAQCRAVGPGGGSGAMGCGLCVQRLELHRLCHRLLPPDVSSSRHDPSMQSRVAMSDRVHGLFYATVRLPLGFHRRNLSASTRRTCSAKNGVSCTMKRKRCSSTSARRQSDLATLWAPRACAPIRAISPTISPGPMTSIKVLPTRPSTSPSNTTYITSPGVPSAKMVEPV